MYTEHRKDLARAKADEAKSDDPEKPTDDKIPETKTNGIAASYENDAFEHDTVQSKL